MKRWSLRWHKRTARTAVTGTDESQLVVVESDPPTQPTGGAWPETMEQFGLHLLTLAEEMRLSLDELESDEDDPDRLQRLYKVDHAITRMRRASRDLRTLAGRADDELSGIDTSLLDVIRMALSSIERYTQVTVGRVADFAVIGYAADDVASLLAALLDNATRYSPGTVSVSAHLTGDGSVLFRIEDTGIGISTSSVETLNAALAGEVPELDETTGRHTGFPVVHRLARRYSIGVRLASRPSPSSGTIAMVTVPPQLLCELPVEPVGRPEPPIPPQTAASRVAVISAPARQSAREETRSTEAVMTDADDGDSVESGSLPRRESVSLRGEQGPLNRPETVRSPQEESAARRSFAYDLDAFSLGSRDSEEKETSS